MDPRGLETLASIVGAEHVLSAREDREDHALDAYGSWRYVAEVASGESVPDVVVRPSSTEEVQALLCFAAGEGIAVTPHGGGTGVMGGAVPLQRGVVLDLRRMDRLRSVDTGAMIAVVEAGALLGDLDDALAKHGLMLGHDPWSRPIATVGGAISTDGVGYLAAAYGSMGDQVIGLEAALATGELLDARAISLRAGAPPRPRLHRRGRHARRRHRRRPSRLPPPRGPHRACRALRLLRSRLRRGRRDGAGGHPAFDDRPHR